MRIIDEDLFIQLGGQASSSPRRRAHLSFHSSPEEDIHRLCIAAEPDTYVRPHRHGDGKWELFIPLKGAFSVLVFDDNGKVSSRHELEPGSKCCGIELEAGLLHAFVSGKSGSVAIEVKRGPFVPTPESDFASWAPREGDDLAAGFLDWMRNASPGDSFHGA